MSKPIVSIIIPCFNSEKFIKNTIESCLKQTYENIEIIVIDDGSKDGSTDILKNYAKNHPDRIHLTSQSHKGASAARNLGFKLSKGKYIQWLDSDDLLEPEKIRSQVTYLQKNKNVEGVYGNWKSRNYSHRLDSYNERLNQVILKDIIIDHIVGKWVSLNSYLIRSTLAINTEWDEKLKAGQDRDYWIQIGIKGAKFKYLKTQDCAIKCAFTDKINVSRVDIRWLNAHLKLDYKTEIELQSKGFLKYAKFQNAMAMAFLELAFLGLVSGNTKIGERGFKEASRFIKNKFTFNDDLPFKLIPFLGIKNSIILSAYYKRIKNYFKSKIYHLFNLDLRLTIIQNFKRIKISFK